MKIFVLVSRVPYPLEKGDKLRAYHQVRQLSKQHEVHLCCLAEVSPHPDAISELKKIAHKVSIVPLKKPLIYLRLLRALFSDKPFQVHYFLQEQAKIKIEALIKESAPDHIYCQLIRTAEYVNMNFDAPKTIDYMDTFSIGAERRKQNAPFWMKPLLGIEAQRLTRYENLSFEFFDHHTIISQQDQQLFYHPKRSLIEIVPNGVDTRFFDVKSEVLKAHSRKERSLLFTGNMSYPPNVDCAKFLAREVLPLVRKHYPKTTLMLAGANPHQQVQDLQSENVQVSGWIDDIRSAYAEAEIFVAPMRIGTGLQNKLLEAMSMELPCITSTLANNALGAENQEEILIANTAEEVSQQIIRLMEDQGLRDKLSTQGRQFVLEEYTWESSGTKLSKIMEQNDQ